MALLVSLGNPELGEGYDDFSQDAEDRVYRQVAKSNDWVSICLTSIVQLSQGQRCYSIGSSESAHRGPKLNSLTRTMTVVVDENQSWKVPF